MGLCTIVHLMEEVKIEDTHQWQTHWQVIASREPSARNMSENSYCSRQRSVNWSERDKVRAVQLIIEKEEMLYGLIKGSGTKGIRKKAWEDIANVFNAQADECRNVDQLKKCFENLRTAARKFIDDMKSPIPGVPKPKDPKPSVKIIVNKLEKNPTTTGLKLQLDMKDPDMITPLENVDDKTRVQSSILIEDTDAEVNFNEDSRLSGSEDFTGPPQDFTVEEMRHTEHRVSSTKGKKRSLEDTLLQVEIERSKLETEKLRLEMKHMIEKRTEERNLYELRALGLKKQIMKEQF